MLRIIVCFWNNFKKLMRDEKGTWAAIAVAGIGAGASIGGSYLASKGKKGQYQAPPGYEDIWNKIKSGMAGPGATYTPGFDITQPGVEAAAEETILGKLKNLPKAAEYKTKVEAAKTQQLAREEESALKQQQKEAEMYNRLGIVSSTPWLQRAGELGGESLMRQKDISTGMDVYGLEYGLRADELAENIANQYLSQAQVLGGTQRAGQQWTKGATYQDWARAQEEPFKWAQLGGNVLGQQTQQAPETNLMEQLGGAGMDIGSLMLMMSILGKK